MNDQEIRLFQMFVRVRDFVSENIADFPAQTLGRQKFDALEAVVTELEQHGAAEESGASAARLHTQSKREARQSLREKMEMISRTARRMAKTGDVGSRFSIPRTNGDQALINAARAFASDAEPLKSEFVKWEMPETFLEDLNAAIEDFEEAVNNRNISASSRTQATAAIDVAISKGKEAVRDLDQIARNKYKENHTKLAAWKSASHTERAPRASKKVEPSTTNA